MDKSNAAKVNRHKESYEKLLETVKQIITNDEIMLDWDNKGDQLVRDVNRITDDFLAAFKDLKI